MNGPSLKKRDKTDNYYRKLQDQTLERLTALSGNVWTDFNIHDPGITISDYLNYALYDLHYRLQFALDAYLFASTAHRDYLQKGLFPKEELYVRRTDATDAGDVRKSIVTEADYEKLIGEKHRDTLLKCVVRLNRETYKYDLFLKLKTNSGQHAAQVEEAVRNTYHRHRNIGENIGRIYHQGDEWKKLENRTRYKRPRYSRSNTYRMPEFGGTLTQSSPDAKPFSSDYHSIQYDFPENYGISERGIPRKEDQGVYEAKVLQLKAYLLLFDFLLADTLLQAKNISKLFDLSTRIPKDTIPDVGIPAGEKIVDAPKKEAQKLRSQNFYHEQKSGFLNMLDVLYGEDTRTLPGQKDIDTLNKKRAELLRFLPVFNENRFRSFNIREPNSTAPLQQLMEAALPEKQDPRDHVSDMEFLGKHGLRIISDEEFFERYRFFLSIDLIESIKDKTHFHEIEEIEVVYKDRTFHKLRMYINLLWYNVLFESFPKYGGDADHYRILDLPEHKEYLLVFFHPERKIWINMGLFFSDKSKAVEIANLFWLFVRKIYREGVPQRLYLIEHLLLADGSPADANRLSVVVPQNFVPDTQRAHFEAALRKRLPAHLYAQLFYLEQNIFQRFSKVYFKWRKALAAHDERDSSEHAQALSRILQSMSASSKSISF